MNISRVDSLSLRKKRSSKLSLDSTFIRQGFQHLVRVGNTLASETGAGANSLVGLGSMLRA